LPFLSATTLAQQPTNSDRARARVFRDKVEPRWLPGGDSFWYRNDLPDGKKEYVLVDAVKGERRVIDEPPKVPRDPAAELKPRPSRADSSTETLLRFINRSGVEARLFWIDPGGRRQSYGALKAGETKEQHTFEGHVWWIESADGTPLGIFEGEEMTTDAVIEPPTANGAPKRDAKPEQPPRDWRASIKDHNVWIRHRLTGEEVQLSHDGKPDDPYREPFRWSPDGKKLVALQTKPAQERKVWLVESSPADQSSPSSRATTTSSPATALHIRARGSSTWRSARRFR
jgi:hypothetical protein